MNVGLYSGAAGMRVGQDYQELLSENLSLQSVPGFKQSLPVFSTDIQAATGKQPATNSGNAAAVRMTRVIDFSQGPVQPSGDPYHVAIEGQAFFQVREADGSTSYTRNGSFSLSPKGELHTSDGATVLSKGGSPVHVDTSNPGTASIGEDGTISLNGVAQGGLGFVHFDNPSVSLQSGAYGRFTAQNSGDAKSGLGKNDKVLQGSLEESNGNPVEQMADMIQAMRLYEANSKSMQAVDNNQNQLITNLGAHPQG
jgi:flagellar basal-body rod protein FlgF